MRACRFLDAAPQSNPPTYAIAVPARDEESRIEACLTACKAAMERCVEPGLIVLLVNNSRDGTAQRRRGVDHDPEEQADFRYSEANAAFAGAPPSESQDAWI